MLALFIIIGLSLLILVHELGHFLAAKLCGMEVQEFGFGFPPRLAARRFGETEYSINLLPFGGFVRLEDEYGAGENPSPRSFARKPHLQRAFVMVAGVIMNVFLGWLLLTGVFLSGVPQHLAVVAVSPNSPAAQAGIRAGDIISAAHFGQVILEDPVPLDSFIAMVRTSGEAPFSLSLIRDGETVSETIQGRLNPPENEGPLGVSLSEIGTPPLGFFGALREASITTAHTIALIAQALFLFFRNVFAEPQLLEAVAGPVGVVTFAAQTGSLGLAYLFQFIAFISLNVALFNVLPFPALDGGRLPLLLIERIKGNPISRRTQIGINAAGFALLLILIIVVTVSDVRRLVLLPGFAVV